MARIVSFTISAVVPRGLVLAIFSTSRSCGMDHGVTVEDVGGSEDERLVSITGEGTTTDNLALFLEVLDHNGISGRYEIREG